MAYHFSEISHAVILFVPCVAYFFRSPLICILVMFAVARLTFWLSSAAVLRIAPKLIVKSRITPVVATVSVPPIGIRIANWSFAATQGKSFHIGRIAFWLLYWSGYTYLVSGILLLGN